MIGASPEVLQHHANLHRPCGEDVPAAVYVCPCGVSVLICCGECGEQVFLAARAGELCEHAGAVL